MQTSRAQALRLPAKTILALLAAIGLLLGGSSFTTTAHWPAHGFEASTSFDASFEATAPSAKIAAATSSIIGLPQSHGGSAFRLQRAVLVRQLAAHGGSQFGISGGPVLLPAAALLELERLAGPVARGVLGFARPGRGPPQHAGI